MYKGMYIIASGAILKDDELGMISRNMANSNTYGFKRDSLTFRSYYLPMLDTPARPDERVMVEKGEVVSDYSFGTMLKTGNPLDVAIDGDGFFVLENGQYTRRGDFRLDENGDLINHEGVRVLGEGGQPINLEGGEVVITPEGEIILDGSSVGRLQIVDFEDRKALLKAGDSTYVATSEPIPAESGVRQGYLESSNVNIISEMVRMIETVREFEVFQRMVRAYDEAVAKASNEISRI